MSFFKWFSAASRPQQSAGDDARRPRTALATPQPEVAASGSGERKIQRHARRDQLYVAIREAMTRAGVLSASYKFKVLSLDPQGQQFLVMMDLASPRERLGEVEMLIVQAARARFEITVTAVYWRIEDAAAVSPPAARARPAVPSGTTAAARPRYAPIEPDEVAAFRQSVRAVTARAPAPARGVTTRSGPRAERLTGFEDTERIESAATPALSSTQYGDLT
ncbi:hypothetical protein [Polaromonas sp.]|uniref:hypothetical protein n=1 Tax=Polaromonas sp. TaxID=1869339 RepID=UPI00286CF05C|nr:hypothetical protein [Polaromonas sp.]